MKVWTRKSDSNDFPKYVHLIYFPWSADQQLKEDEMDFDHSFCYKFSDSNPSWEVKMWTLSKVKEFSNENYPGIWEIVWDAVDRPTQAVDLFRILITYHYGGIYWQYGSKQLCDLQFFVPNSRKRRILFVEAIYSKAMCNQMSVVPIRKGKPEEAVRICNQIFSAYSKDPFLEYCLKKSLDNLKNYKVTCDYDILYIGANAMMSEAFDEFIKGKYLKTTMLVPMNIHHRMFGLSSRGSWRRD